MPIMNIAREMLEDNKKTSLEDFLKRALPLMMPKAGGGGGATGAQKVILNENGEIIALHCAWYDKYFRVENFGKKASTKNGFNSYSTMGVSARNAFFTGREKEIDATRKAVFAEEISIEEGRNKISELENLQPNKELPDYLEPHVVQVEDGKLSGELPEPYTAPEVNVDSA